MRVRDKCSPSAGCCAIGNCDPCLKTLHVLHAPGVSRRAMHRPRVLPLHESLLKAVAAVDAVPSIPRADAETVRRRWRPLIRRVFRAFAALLLLLLQGEVVTVRSVLKMRSGLMRRRWLTVKKAAAGSFHRSTSFISLFMSWSSAYLMIRGK